MLNVLSELKLGRARNVRTWEEVLNTFQPRKWDPVPVREGRMAYSVVGGDQKIGRMLALVMLEDAVAPEVAMASGTMFFCIRGKLHVWEGNWEVVMEPWDLVHLGGSRQGPYAIGLYLGLWAFPQGNPLLRMVGVGTGY